ncbi:MAG: archaellum operon transcriptional activator EarA family protein [Candidatus Hydrothermarchaeales archaeon]
MARKYRSNILITMAILETIDDNGLVNVRRLMMHANVPHPRLKSKMDELLSLGLVTQSIENEGCKLYTLTDKGRRILLKMREFFSFLTYMGLTDLSLGINSIIPTSTIYDHDISDLI